jgi:hypothetical protein
MPGNAKSRNHFSLNSADPDSQTQICHGGPETAAVMFWKGSMDIPSCRKSLDLVPAGRDHAGAAPLLLVAAGSVLLGAFVISRHKFLQLLRRTRWIMLSLLLIYAYSTPGQPLSVAFGLFSPSREGLVDGVVQLVRLLAALAGLAILLDRLHRLQLIADLYTVCTIAMDRDIARASRRASGADAALCRGRDVA